MLYLRSHHRPGRLCASALAVLAGLGVPCAQAQLQLGQPLGRLYLSAAPTYQVSERNVALYESFSIFLVADIDYFELGLYGQQTVNGLREWEASVQVPPELLVLARVIPQQGAVDTGAGDDNWIVASSSLLSASSTPHPVARYDCLMLDNSQELLLSLAPPTPSRIGGFPGHAATPAWLEWSDSGECPGPCLREFGDWSGSLRLNCWTGCTPECVIGSYPYVIAPAEGEQLMAGSTYRIEWYRTSAGPVEQILFSDDDGRSWEVVAQPPEDLGYFDWIVPNRPTNRARLSVSPCTGRGRFSIVPGAVPTNVHSWGGLKSVYSPRD